MLGAACAPPGSGADSHSPPVASASDRLAPGRRVSRRPRARFPKRPAPAWFRRAGQQGVVVFPPAALTVASLAGRDPDDVVAGGSLLPSRHFAQPRQRQPECAAPPACVASLRPQAPPTIGHGSKTIPP